MKKKYKEKLQEAAKKFCLKCELPPDVIITSTKYSLAGLIAFHAGAEWALKNPPAPLPVNTEFMNALQLLQRSIDAADPIGYDVLIKDLKSQIDSILAMPFML